MFAHHEPLAHEPDKEVRAVPSLYPQSVLSDSLVYRDNLPLLVAYIGDPSVKTAIDVPAHRVARGGEGAISPNRSLLNAPLRHDWYLLAGLRGWLNGCLSQTFSGA